MLLFKCVGQSGFRLDVGVDFRLVGVVMGKGGVNLS